MIVMKVNREKCVDDCLHYHEGRCSGVDKDVTINCLDYEIIPNDYDGHKRSSQNHNDEMDVMNRSDSDERYRKIG